jgi:hypothetical protein
MPLAEHAVRVRHGEECLQPGHAHGDLGPVALPHGLLLAVNVQVSVETDGDLAVRRPFPEAFRVLGLLELGAAREQVAVLATEHRVIQHEVLRARLGEHGDALRLGVADDDRSPQPWSCARCRAGRR